MRRYEAGSTTWPGRKLGIKAGSPSFHVFLQEEGGTSSRSFRFTRKEDPIREAFEFIEVNGAEEFLWGPSRRSLALYKAFLERSCALRYEDPRRMLLYAQGALAGC